MRVLRLSFRRKSITLWAMDPILAHHLIWTAYGWWLPNDPRGSMSKTVESDPIAELGELRYGRRKIQPNSRTLREFYARAPDVLKFPLLEMEAADVALIADAFAACIRNERYTCYACAIMPDHVHILIRKHRDRAEEMALKLQHASRLVLQKDRAGRWLCGADQEAHPIWGGPGWKVFLGSPEEIERTVRYLQDNPVKRRRAKQEWTFVQPYDGWPRTPRR